jgi:hypothetical protein
VIVVHQTPPRVFNFKWIAQDSPAPFGGDTTYRSVRIALPYLIVLAAFHEGRGGQLYLGAENECFFRNEPLKSLDDKLCYPALLNCSRFEPQEGRPLSWICTQHLDRSQFVVDGEKGGTAALARCVHGGLTALLGHLLESGFNLSSEHHETSSWFSTTVEARIDERIGSVERWEEETAKDPLFVLEVPWLATGKSLGEVAARMMDRSMGRHAEISSASDVARLIFNSKRRRRRRSRAAELIEQTKLFVTTTTTADPLIPDTPDPDDEEADD